MKRDLNFMAIKTERGLPSIDDSVGHLYRPPEVVKQNGKREDDDGEELKKRLPNPAAGMSRRFDIVRSELFMKRSARCLTG